MYKDVDFLTILIDLIFEKKLFLFIIKECAKEKQI